MESLWYVDIGVLSATYSGGTCRRRFLGNNATVPISCSNFGPRSHRLITVLTLEINGPTTYNDWLGQSAKRDYTNTTTTLVLTAGFQDNRGNRYQNVIPSWILLQQEMMEVAALCNRNSSRRAKSSSQIITATIPTRLRFYRPDALPVAQPTVSEHWRNAQIYKQDNNIYISRAG